MSMGDARFVLIVLRKGGKGSKSRFLVAALLGMTGAGCAPRNDGDRLRSSE